MKSLIDKRKLSIVVLKAGAIVIVLIPFLVVVHEIGHAIMVYLLGGSVSQISFNPFAAHVSYSGVRSPADKTLVHLSGVAMNMLVGFALILHVYKHNHRPIVELATVMYGFVMVFTDVVFYSIGDMFRGSHNSGDFSKIYRLFPSSPLLFLLFDIVYVYLLYRLMTSPHFHASLSLPRL